MRRPEIRSAAAALVAALWLCPARAPADTAPVKLAVFRFELEDVSAAAAPQETAADATLMDAVTEKARQVLAQSGRYAIVDAGAAATAPARQHALRSCDGCEAALAQQLGAQESLLGVVRRIEQSSYEVSVQIRDARSGKLVNQQAAAFLGGSHDWANGVSSLLRHRVLSADYPP